MSQWFIRQRQEFIARKLTEGGVNASHLMEAFDISKPQASKDFRRFESERPGVMVYDMTAKRYVAAKQNA